MKGRENMEYLDAYNYLKATICAQEAFMKKMPKDADSENYIIICAKAAKDFVVAFKTHLDAKKEVSI